MNTSDKLALPSDINTDLIVERVLGLINVAVAGWKNGFPHDETALLNRITEQLLQANKCDVGTTTPCWVETQLYALHRQQDGRADKFGSDLAVTIEAPEVRFKKTAFFQFKISSRGKVVLTRKQLRETRVAKEIRDRAFVFVVDDITRCYRVRSTRLPLREITHGSKQATFDVVSWPPLSEWVILWFKCRQGKPTLPLDPHPPEALLERHRILAAEQSAPNLERPDDFIPARVWAITRFTRRL